LSQNSTFYLGKEQTMLTTGVFPFPFSEEGSEAVQPLATADQQIVRGERVGQVLEPVGIPTAQEGIGSLLEVDAFFLHTTG
jgi:hypothetical protein